LGAVDRGKVWVGAETDEMGKWVGGEGGVTWNMDGWMDGKGKGKERKEDGMEEWKRNGMKRVRMRILRRWVGRSCMIDAGRYVLHMYCTSHVLHMYFTCLSITCLSHVLHFACPSHVLHMSIHHLSFTCTSPSHPIPAHAKNPYSKTMSRKNPHAVKTYEGNYPNPISSTSTLTDSSSHLHAVLHPKSRKLPAKNM
jgi:hypothetical protein